MKPVVLTEAQIRNDLYPLSLTRLVADLRIGILTIREKWELLLNSKVEVSEEENTVAETAVVFPANMLPSKKFISSFQINGNSTDITTGSGDVKFIQYPWDIFTVNDWALREDYAMVTHKRVSQSIPESVQSINSRQIFIEEGATLTHCVLNASAGPIYIGKNAEVMEGALIRGPFALCEGAVVKMGAKIYGATTIGPYSIAGGEIKNSVIIGYSNKAHDGYLGDSVIGEWCNLGAGTSNSNIKNNATEVKVWHHASNNYKIIGLKCGLIMGDYSRSAINTSFNTGSVVGVCANVFSQGLTPKFTPNFTWGTEGCSYKFDKAIEDIGNWKKLKNKSITADEVEMLRHIFENSNR